VLCFKVGRQPHLALDTRHRPAVEEMWAGEDHVRSGRATIGFMMQASEVLSNRVVRLADLTITDFAIRDKEFRNCYVLGPAVLAATGDTQFRDCTFDGEVEGLLWEIPPSRAVIIGAIEVNNCLFSGCRFQAVGFAGGPEFISKFKQGVSLQ
jgi:hypothetical protein